ncbi:MAG: hypothetical protein ACLF0G_13470 [Candidatus Brocadiia bacterium]
MRALVGALLLLVLGGSRLDAGESLLANGDFAKGLEGWWVPETPQKLSLDAEHAPEGHRQCLRVDIRTEAKHYGQVGQYLEGIEPRTVYTLEGLAQGSREGLAFFQVKLLRGREEFRRITTSGAGTAWTPIACNFSTEDADRVAVLCRFRQGSEAVGHSAWFAGLRLARAPPPRLTRGDAVPTFACLGLTASYEGGLGRDVACQVRYRERGEEAWRRGLDLVVDRARRELRGSLFGLEPDTPYEAECRLVGQGGEGLSTLRLAARTWPEEVPVGETRHLPPGTSKQPLVIADEGTPEAWVRYAPPPGNASTVDAGKRAENAVRIEGAAYVLVDGITVRGGTDDAIFIRESHHVRLRGCDIAGWGQAGTRKEGLPDGLYVDERGRPINGQAGVQLHRDCAQVVVEHCFIHAPRGTANSWKYGHPMGPQGINLSYTAGNNVVRYNDLVGSESHWWNDAIEGAPNRAVEGGPHRDSDIYGNVLAFANDDGTELDGGQINVRYWHNWVDKALCGVSCAPNRRGPSYVFRNLIVLSGDEHFHTGSGFKMGGARFPNQGLSILAHNTVWTRNLGLSSGHYGEGPSPIRTRNNLFMGPLPGYGRIRYRYREGGDFDYDLIPPHGVYGTDEPVPGREAHAVVGTPRVRDASAGDFRLRPGSPGIDAGLRLPGLNDGFAGEGPDLGAFERGRDATALFPPRPGGLGALPLHLRLRHTAGAAPPSATVRLACPPGAGEAWQAHPNSPWLRCEPASGRGSAQPQEVAVSLARRDLPVRLHRGAVTFRTDRGLCRTVMVDVRVYPPDLVVVAREAEAGEVQGGMAAVADPTASGGAYVHAPQGAEGAVSFRFAVPRDGVYYVVARCMVPPPAAQAGVHDSFRFAMDGGERRIWDLTNRAVGAWDWQAVDARDAEPSPWPFRLEAGAHRLTIASREPLARLDRVAVTNSPYPEEPPAP